MSQLKVANPAPLGLIGFGMTTVLLNIFNAAIMNPLLGSNINAFLIVVFAVGLTNGGLAQVIAGIWDLKNGNTFGAVAFVSYGFFWLSLVFINVLPNLGWMGSPVVTDLMAKQLALVPYLVLWGFFTLGMLFATLKTNRVLQFVFLTLTILFFLLALGHYVFFATASTLINNIAGYEGIVCGASAIYLAIADVVNEAFGRSVLPIGSMKAKAAPKKR
jgi:succinate-acetate transporter protein